MYFGRISGRLSVLFQVMRYVSFHSRSGCVEHTSSVLAPGLAHQDNNMVTAVFHNPLGISPLLLSPHAQMACSAQHSTVG